jgi:hypothetical protein
MALDFEQSESSTYFIYRTYLVNPGVAQRLFSEK